MLHSTEEYQSYSRAIHHLELRLRQQDRTSTPWPMLMARAVQDSMQLRCSKWRLPQKGIQRPCVEGQGRCEQGHAYSEIGRRHISEAERYRSEGAGRLSKSLPFYPQKPRVKGLRLDSRRGGESSRGTSNNPGRGSWAQRWQPKIICCIYMMM
jgi:hypothetical protein